MRTEQNVSDAHLILDELDRLARSTDSNAVFWQHFLTSLQTLVNAQAAAILLPIDDSPTPIAQQGKLGQEPLAAFESGWRQESHAEFWSGETSSGSWFVVPMRSQEPESGWLLATFGNPQGKTSIQGLTALMQAFAEVYATHDAMTRNRRMQRSWELFQQGFQRLSRVDNREELYRSLVDQLAQVVGAARVTLVILDRSDHSFSRVVATCGVSKIEAAAPTVKALASLASEAAENQRPVFAMDPLADPAHDLAKLERRSEDGIFENRLVIPWEATSESHDAESHDAEWLIIEWPDRDSMADTLPSIAPGLSLFHSVYRQQSRWCSLPKWLRQRVLELAPTPVRRRSKTIRRIGVAAAMTMLVWFLLRPYPMTIEAEGVLEPVSRRMVHATADGVLVELFVDDGDTVAKDQKLAKLRSPGLELQIEDALGQMRAIVEKRNGLHVAINQLSPSSPEALPTQTRISTDLLILEAQEKQLREKLEFLKREQGRLLLTSPIDGVVVASELRRELENRPLRRGDTLFQIVELSGDWQLRVFVADQDSGYVDTFYGGDRGTVDYVFDSMPSERLRGEVTHLANVIEYRMGTTGHRNVVVAVERNDANRVHMGARASVSLACGKQPFWFVWSRPLVEFLQKRFAFFSKSYVPPQSSEPGNP